MGLKTKRLGVGRNRKANLLVMVYLYTNYADVLVPCISVVLAKKKDKLKFYLFQQTATLFSLLVFVFVNLSPEAVYINLLTTLYIRIIFLAS